MRTMTVMVPSLVARSQWSQWSQPKLVNSHQMFSVVLCPFGEYDAVLHKLRISEQAGPADVLFVVHIIVISLITSIALISFHFRTFTFWFFIRASCTCSFHRILTSFLGGFFLLCPVFFLLGFITCSFNDIKNKSKQKKIINQANPFSPQSVLSKNSACTTLYHYYRTCLTFQKPFYDCWKTLGTNTNFVIFREG